MLNIARQIQVAWDSTKSATSGLHEAEIVPIGNTSNEKRKLSNLTKRNNTLKEHENVPLPGFTLLKTERKTWGSLDQTWLIIDPRGFLSRISPNNLEKILHVTGITEGLIQEKCVWAREDSQTTMTLVPVTSPDYVAAVQNTELIEDKISIKDVQIGDTVMTQTGIDGTYMGVLSLYGPIIEAAGGYKPQVFLRRQIIEVSKGKYVYQSDAKILKVTNRATTPITREESALRLNTELAAGKAQFSTINNFNTGYFSNRGAIVLVSVNAVPKIPMSFIEITKDDAEKIFADGFKKCDIGMLAMIETGTGRKFIVEQPTSSYSQGRTTCDLNKFDTAEIITDLSTTDLIMGPKNTSNNWVYRSNPRTPPKQLDNFAKFYKIVKHVKSETFV
jgi:hypothetical protein